VLLRTKPARPSPELLPSATKCRLMRVIGIDLAWGEGTDEKLANETGLVAADPTGEIIDAGWACGIEETVACVSRLATAHTLLMVDAPLIVSNAAGQRLCEKQVGQRYMHPWKVGANSTNQASQDLGGVALLRALEALRWTYHDGRDGPPSRSGRYVAEVFPYTTLVGAPELGYDVERPIYKNRRPASLRSLGIGEFRKLRASNCDELIRRLVTLRDADPPLHLGSHPVTKTLMNTPSPLDDDGYKHGEDLIDAVLCAWTGLLWLAHGLHRCQVLGADDPLTPVATIIAPARPTQRRPAASPKGK
jgi:predicted RNase H-like nuclease